MRYFGLRAKLIFGFLIIASMVSLTGGIGLVTLQLTQTQFDLVIEETVPAVVALGQIKAGTSHMLEAANHIIILRLMSDDFESESHHLEEERTSFKVSKDEVDQWIRAYASVAKDHSQQNYALRLAQASQSIHEASQDLIELDVKTGVDDQILDRFEAFEDAEHHFAEVLEETLAMETANLEQNQTTLVHQIANFRLLNIGAVIATFMLALIFSYLLATTLTRPLIKLKNAAEQIRKGQLDTKVEIDSGDEIGILADTFNKMTADLSRAQAELVQANDSLRAELAERKRTEATLADYAAKLEHSNRELQEFAYMASHDLQEPLRKIQTFGDRLQTKYGEVLTGQGHDYLSRMQKAAGRMRSLIDGLLTYSRVTTQSKPFQPVDLAQIVQDVLSDLEVQLDQVKGQVTVGSLPTLPANPIQMRQLFQNLIGNALKFHRQDVPPEIKIQAWEPGQIPSVAGVSQAVPAGQEQITLADNGIGFDKKYNEQIFQVFQRLHNRTEYEGAGIGLATCRKIVEQHGGTIAARSTPGVGTTFLLTFPQKQMIGDDTYD